MLHLRQPPYARRSGLLRFPKRRFSCEGISSVPAMIGNTVLITVFSVKACRFFCLNLGIPPNPKIKEGAAVPEPKIQCLQRNLRCPTIENESRVLKQSLRLTLHRRPPPNDESSRTSNDTEHPVPFGTTYQGCCLLPTHFKSLIEELSGLLLLCHPSRLARKTLTLYNSSASQDKVDRASITSGL